MTVDSIKNQVSNIGLILMGAVEYLMYLLTLVILLDSATIKGKTSFIFLSFFFLLIKM